MQIIKSSGRTLLAVAILSVATAAQAQSIFKADNANNLNDPAAWVGGVAPTSANVAVWNNTVQINNNSVLGADTGWAGIQILDPALPIDIGAGNALTLGASGIDMSAATNSLTLANSVNIAASQTWDVTNGLTLTISGVVSGSSSAVLSESGNGTLVLGAANTYTGGTVINSGIVQPVTATSFGVATTAITNNGATLLLSTFPNSGIIANTFNVNGTTYLDMFNRNISAVLDGAFSGNGKIYVTNDTQSGSTLTFGGNGSGGGNFTAFTGSIIIVDTNAAGIASAGNIRFNNGGGNNNLGNAAMTLNLGGPNSAAHFTEKNSGTATHFGALIGGPNTQLASVENYTIGEANLNTVFAGTITGAGSTLIKSGTGTFTLTGNNANTGTTTVNAGILQIGDGVTVGAGTLGSGAIVLNAAGTLVFNKPDDFEADNNISGAGVLIKTNVNNLTYGGNDTASGALIVSQGAVTLGGAGEISAPITLASGTLFDVTENPAYTLNSTLSGSGAVAGLLMAAGGAISPGGIGATATLTFSNGLSELGNVTHQFELSSPAGANDLINIVGDLTLTGLNNIVLNHVGGGSIPLGTYPLINYTGNFNGDLSNLSVTVAGVTGTLTNANNQIAIIISPGARGPLNLTWVGDGAANNWDTSTSNWVNNATAFNFLAGDTAIFDDTGVANSTITLAAAVLPAAVVVNSTGNYTLTGAYSISGAAALTKTNSGTLSVSATNSYTGPTIVGGGTFEAFNLANGGSASAIGAASSDPSNLVFFGSVFKYSGDPTSTDRGATLNAGGVTMDIASGTSLTENGMLTGPGALTLVDSGTLTLGAANPYTGGTVISNGVLATANDLANTAGFGPTNSPISFYGGTLALYRNSGDDGSTVFSFFNPLVVSAGQVGNLTIFQRGNVYGSLTGSGVININSSGQRAGFVGDWSAFTGTVNITGNFRIGNPDGYANAIINLNDNSDLDGGNAAGTYSSAPTFDIGELDGTSLAILGGNTKPSPNPNWRVGWKNTTSTFAGTIENAAGGVSSITKVGTGTWYLTGQSTFIGSTTISNGVLALAAGPNGDGAIGSTTNIFISAGAFLDVSGRSDGTMPVNYGQVLAGNGTLNGSLDTSLGGTVSPGGGIMGDIGTLTVTNSALLGGTAWMKLDRDGRPNSDKLVSTLGTLNYENGTLIVTNIGARFHVGDTFTLFAGSLSSSFGNLVLPGYYTWDTSQLSVNGSIEVTAISPPPAISNVDFSTLASGYITLNAGNGVPNGPVNVLSTTNLALPLSSWTTVLSTGFDGNGNLNAQIFFDGTQPQTFFLLQGE